MDIILSITSSYTRFCGVLITSIFENNTSDKISIHIFHKDLTTDDKQVLNNIGIGYKQTIKFYDLTNYSFDGMPQSLKWPEAVYYRLIAPSKLQGVKSALYLDCDIICNGSLKELFDIDLGSDIIGAIDDTLSHCIYHLDSLDYGIDYYYFNSGVILIDVEKWNKYDITTKCISYIKQNEVKYPDQDSLNVILHKYRKRIYYKWNFLAPFHTSYTDYSFFLDDYNGKSKNFPKLIHFNGDKPWDSKSLDPYKCLFFKYQEKTIWKDEIPAHTLKQKLFHFRRIILDRLGILKLNPLYTYGIEIEKSNK